MILWDDCDLFSFVVVWCSGIFAPCDIDHSTDDLIDHGVKPYFSP